MILKKFITKILKKTSLLLLSYFFLLINFTSSIKAQESSVLKSPLGRFKDTATESGYNTAAENTAKSTIIVDVLIYVLGLVGLFFLIMIIYSGFQWIAAGGNEDTITKAKTRLKNSIIGFVIVLLSYAITIFVINIIQDPSLYRA